VDPGPVWPDEDSHSPWTDSQGPRQCCPTQGRQAFRSPLTLLQDRDSSAGALTSSGASLGKAFEHGLLQLGFCQKLFETGVVVLQLSQPLGLLGLYPAVLLPPAVVGRLRHNDDTADVGDGLALGNQLLGGFELTGNLLG